MGGRVAAASWREAARPDVCGYGKRQWGAGGAPQHLVPSHPPGRPRAAAGSGSGLRHRGPARSEPAGRPVCEVSRLPRVQPHLTVRLRLRR
ncbi:hypothetical protein NN561_007176 [Cricetulus griseus]